MTPTDFAQKIRTKYPGVYDHLSDEDLTQRVITKYPVYKSQVNIPEQPKNIYDSSQDNGFVNNTINKVRDTGISVAKALTSSEQGVGETIGQGAALNSGNFNEAQQSKDQANKMLGDLEISINKKKKNGENTSRMEALYNKVKGTLDTTGNVEDIAPATQKTNTQALGEVAGVGLDMISGGAASEGAKTFSLAKDAVKGTGVVKDLSTTQKVIKIAKNTAKASAEGAALGYGYDVANSAKDNNVSLKPGAGAATGAAIPLVIGGVKIVGAISEAQAPRIINSLIGTRKGDFKYGKNPGRAIAETGITANSLPDLETKVTQGRQTAGSTIGEITSKLEGKAEVNISESLKPIDEAIKTAKKTPKTNESLLQRLQNVKQDLINNLTLPHDNLPNTSDIKTGLAGQDTYKMNQGTYKLQKNPITGVYELSGKYRKPGINFYPKYNAANRNIEKISGNINEIGSNIEDVGLKANTSFKNAFNLKKTVGDITKFTGNPSDDGIVNGALKQVYGNIKDAMNEAAGKVDPELARQLAKANERYADFTSAEVALKNRIALNQGKNLVSMPIKVGSVAGLIATLGTGVGIIPVLAAVGAGVLDKALASTAVKTRIASWLAKESPDIVAGIVEHNPGIGAILKKAFTKEYTPIENALKDVKNLPNKEGGFVSIGGKGASDIASGKLTDEAINKIPTEIKQEVIDAYDFLNKAGAKEKNLNINMQEDINTFLNKVEKGTVTPEDLDEAVKIQRYVRNEPVSLKIKSSNFVQDPKTGRMKGKNKN